MFLVGARGLGLDGAITAVFTTGVNDWKVRGGGVVVLERFGSNLLRTPQTGQSFIFFCTPSLSFGLACYVEFISRFNARMYIYIYGTVWGLRW